jgi:ribosomal protein S18 acetylase RimI-like enzyme
MAAALVMTSQHEPHRTADASQAVSLRLARMSDCRRIAELFRISSEGIADYVWSQLRDEFPGLSLLEIGERRYRREDTAFSYQNCLVAERAGEVIGMVHSYVIEPPADQQEPAEPGDPVLRPYAELEAPGSLYIAGLALLPEHRDRGIGTLMLVTARHKARGIRRAAWAHASSAFCASRAMPARAGSTSARASV